MSKQNLDWEKQEKKEKANYSNELNCHSTGKSIKRKQHNQSKGNNSQYDINSRRLLHKKKINTILPQIKWN